MQLKVDIDNGKANASIFNEVQLDAIKRGLAQIPGWTWDHSELPGVLRLVPRELHNELIHTGSFSYGAYK
jgi:hypothetical protein